MSESITFRCPDDLASMIKSRSQEPGKDKTSVVIGILRQSLQALPLEERNNLPPVSAIYIVYQQDKLLYVGKTGNLKKRWLSHHRLVQFLDAGSGVYIAWFPCNVEQLDVVEDTFIELLEPEFNGQKVVGQALVTFWVDKQDWNSFKELCKSEGTTASVVLRDFVERRAKSNSIPDLKKTLDDCLTEDNELLDKLIAKRLDKKLDECIGAKLDKHIDAKLDEKMQQRLEVIEGKLIA